MIFCNLMIWYWYNIASYNSIIYYHKILHHRNQIIPINNKHIYHESLSKAGVFIILYNGDKALFLKLPQRFIYIIVKSTMQDGNCTLLNLWPIPKISMPLAFNYLYSNSASMHAIMRITRYIIYTNVIKIAQIMTKICLSKSTCFKNLNLIQHLKPMAQSQHPGLLNAQVS